ncbi:MAG TPA: hypothetical protein VLQ48_00540 [Chloroflexia bacterium]|nr:hypothetical protein [Chloroflexia bacterium]
MMRDTVADTLADMLADMVTGTTDQPPLMAETDITGRVAQRVYCAEDSPLRLGDGTSLHLEWVIEGRDGQLYKVRSELGGWLGRTLYSGKLDGMKLVPPEKAETILWLTYADTDGDDLARIWRRDDRGSTIPMDFPLGKWAH